MEIKFHTLERTFWLEARTARPFGLGHIFTVLLGLTTLLPSSYNYFTKEIHINLAAITTFYEKDMPPPNFEVDSLSEQVCINIERQAIRKAIHEAGEDIYTPLQGDQVLIGEMMKSSNPEMTPDSHWIVEKLRDKASEISAGF
jgi:hypothetical protein